MTINAAQSDRLGLEVRVVLTLVARNATGALGGRVQGALPREVNALERLRCWESRRRKSGRPGMPCRLKLRSRRALGPCSLGIVTSRRAEDHTEEDQERERESAARSKTG